MKKSLKFLAGALAAVTLLSSALAVSVSAASPVYNPGNVHTAPVDNNGGTNTKLYPSLEDYLSTMFPSSNKNEYSWWYDKYFSYREFANLKAVDLSNRVPEKFEESPKNTKVKSTVPWAAVRKVKTSISVPAEEETDKSNNNVIYKPSVLPGGKYYPSNLVDIQKFFKNNTYEISMYKGQLQLMNTAYRMYSTNSDVVLCYTSGTDQILKAVGTGTTHVYFYTNGGVPFLRLSITVKDPVPPATPYVPVVDIAPATWNLAKVGDSTTVSVFASENYTKDIVLTVVYGQASINGNKVTAKGTGAIVLCAYSESDRSIRGYAVLYVGEYTSSIVDGCWKPTNSGICGNFWNPNLWLEDGYIVCGWVEVNGIYIPVIKEVEKPDTPIVPPTVTKPIKYYTLRELINICRGDLNIVLKVIEMYKENGITYYDEMYTETIKNLLKNLDLSDYYFAQLH